MSQRVRRLLLGVYAVGTRGEFRPAVAKLVGGSTAGRFFLVAVSPVLTRIFTPDEIGNFAAALAVMGIIMAVGDLSYRAAIGLPERDSDAANLVALSLSLVVAIGVTVGILMSVSDAALLSLLGLAAVGSHVLFIVVGQIVGGAAIVFSFWATRKRRFGPMALADMSQSVVQAGLQVAFGLVGLGVAGLLGGWVAGATMGVLILGTTAWRSGRSAFTEVSPRRMWEVGMRYRRFAVLTTPSVLMNTIGLRAPLLVLIAIYGSEVGGLYALAERVAILPVTLAAAAVGQVYYAHAAPLARRQDDALKDLFLRTTKTLALYAVVPMVLVAVLAPALFGFIFGSDWVEAGVYSAILAPWFYVILITNPTGRTLDVLERQDLHLTRESIRLVVLGLTVTSVLLVQPPPIGAVLLLSVAGCATYGIYGYISWRAIMSDRPRRSVDLPRPPGVTDSTGSP